MELLPWNVQQKRRSGTLGLRSLGELPGPNGELGSSSAGRNQTCAILVYHVRLLRRHYFSKDKMQRYLLIFLTFSDN